MQPSLDVIRVLAKAEADSYVSLHISLTQVGTSAPGFKCIFEFLSEFSPLDLLSYTYSLRASVFLVFHGFRVQPSRN